MWREMSLIEYFDQWIIVLKSDKVIKRREMLAYGEKLWADYSSVDQDVEV